MRRISRPHVKNPACVAKLGASCYGVAASAIRRPGHAECSYQSCLWSVFLLWFMMFMEIYGPDAQFWHKGFLDPSANEKVSIFQKATIRGFFAQP